MKEIVSEKENAFKELRQLKNNLETVGILNFL